MNAERQETAPILPYYQAKGLLHSVDGMADMSEVAGQIDRVLGGVKV
jgi:adenylate kinase